jgi:Fe-S cluster assembly ATP-binding protein
MLQVKGLTVSVAGRTILGGVDFHVDRGETVVLFGPNGSGKTSLLKTIIGHPDYRVESGSIVFKGRDITGLPTDERARLGIGIAFQRPPAVRGVRMKDMLHACMKIRGETDGEIIDEYARRLNLEDFLRREINLGFSGGEIKRSELLQLMAQAPDFIMLDEPDSGVDLVSINLVGEVINGMLEKDRRPERRTKAGMIITHAGYILDYVNADRAYVMFEGGIFCSGNPRDVLADIRAKGYEGCVVCER